MSETHDFPHVLALARALAPAERLRLMAELAAELARGAEPSTPVQPALAETPEPAEPLVADADPLDFSSGAPGAGRVPSNGLIAHSGAPVAYADDAGARGQLANEAATLEQHRQIYTDRAKGAHPILRMVYGKDHGDLRQAGWAVVVPATASARLIEALLPLIEHRSRQQGLTLPPISFAGGAETCADWLACIAPDEPGVPSPWHPRRAKRVPVLLYEPDAAADVWLPRYGPQLAAGVVDPDQGVPYYLLFAGRPGPLPQIAGDRAYIPFQVQYDVDLYWGVGRLCFTAPDGTDDYTAYTAYARHVVAFEEREQPPYERRVVYFATDHDPATVASRDGLVLPLATKKMAADYRFTTTTIVGKEASREALRGILRNAPPLLFTATHGADLRPFTTANLPRQQGALVCSDWTSGTVTADHWLDADGLPEDLRVEGMVLICFACFGVGCPKHDTYAAATGRPRQLAPYDLVAALPQRLLARGALAVLGHVDVAWSYGYGDPQRAGVPPQTQGFEDILRHLMDGQRVGYATDAFNTRQAALGSRMSELIHLTRFRQPLPDFTETWLSYHDARAYALLGDPAVRLPFGDGSRKDGAHE